jgi:hypothetical protein
VDRAPTNSRTARAGKETGNPHAPSNAAPEEGTGAAEGCSGALRLPKLVDGHSGEQGRPGFALVEHADRSDDAL